MLMANLLTLYEVRDYSLSLTATGREWVEAQKGEQAATLKGKNLSFCVRISTCEILKLFQMNRNFYK